MDICLLDSSFYVCYWGRSTFFNNFFISETSRSIVGATWECIKKIEWTAQLTHFFTKVVSVSILLFQVLIILFLCLFLGTFALDPGHIWGYFNGYLILQAISGLPSRAGVVIYCSAVLWLWYIVLWAESVFWWNIVCAVTECFKVHKIKVNYSL